MNRAVYRDYPDVQTIAEESTSWPQVSRPVDSGGLGFGMKWNMGWMHDTLAYMREAPIHRKYHHDQLTFSIWYAFFENFVLPLSHDEVVYGKGSLIGKMPGDDWQQFANLRLLFGYMWAHPGKKLLFMGGEFGQRREWTHDEGLEWWVTAIARARRRSAMGARPQRFVCRGEPALYEQDFDGAGFEWIDANDRDRSVLSFLRRPRAGRAASSRSAISRRCRGQTTASACPAADTGASSSTATRPSTAAAASAIWAASRPRRFPRTDAVIR